jgi:hypothetical protein
MARFKIGVNETYLPLDREICFSVECGTIDPASRSIEHLRKILR